LTNCDRNADNNKKESKSYTEPWLFNEASIGDEDASNLQLRQKPKAAR